MLTLQSNRRRYTNFIAKQVLHAHVNQLPPAQQREFIALAFQLIAERTGRSEAEIKAKYWQPRQAVEQ